MRGETGRRRNRRWRAGVVGWRRGPEIGRLRYVLKMEGTGLMSGMWRQCDETVIHGHEVRARSGHLQIRGLLDGTLVML